MSREANVVTALAARAAGANVDSSSGDPGAGKDTRAAGATIQET